MNIQAISTRLRVHCGRCGNFWELYSRDNWQSDNSRVCPHCNAKVDEQTWKNQIIPAFNSVSDANNELVRDVTGYGKAHFSIDVIASKMHNHKRNY